MGWELQYNGTKIRKINNVRIEEELTEPMALFTATMQNPSSTERSAFVINHLVGSNQVKIYRNNVLKFEGFLEEVTPIGLDLELKGRSYEVLLLDERTSRDDEYTAKTGAYILDDATNGIINKYSTKVEGGSISFSETISGTIRFNHDNLLKAVAKTCNIKSKDFWVTYSGGTFYLNAGTRGSGTVGAPTGTYYGGKRVAVTVERKGVRDLINRQRVFGAGDGINQIQCCVPYIDVNIEDGDRSAGFDGYNADCLHSDAITSQSTYGIMEGKPYVDRSIKSLDEAITTSKVLLDEFSGIYKNLGVRFMRYVDLNLGDWIRVIDSKQGVDVTTRIKKLVHRFDIQGTDTIEVILYNPFSKTEDRIRLLERDSDTTNTSGQGATNIFQIQSYENCDFSHPLNVRFRLPDDVVQVNKVLLSFKLENYRAYHTATESGGSHSHDFVVQSYQWPETQNIYIGGFYDTAIPDMRIGGAGNTSPLKSETSASEDAHTHGISFGINETTLISPSVIVTAGINGNETSVGTYTTDQTDIDIVTNVSTTGNWMNVKFAPNKNMRIEANLYIKCYIESK